MNRTSYTVVMFKVVLFVAAALSAIACLAYDVKTRVDLAETQHAIAQRQVELQRLAPADREVQLYRRRKDDLQRRIDLISQVKQVENTTADAVAMLDELGSEASAIQSVSVVDAKKIVVHGRAESEKLITEVAGKLGINVTFEAKK